MNNEALKEYLIPEVQIPFINPALGNAHIDDIKGDARLIGHDTANMKVLLEAQYGSAIANLGDKSD